MLKYGNRDFRNLQEQVYANMKNIQDIIDGSNIIADFKTINIVGEVDIAANLPDPDLYQGDYGDCFIVGDSEEYDLYIFTKAYEEQNAPQWFNLGTFPKPGPEGPQGVQGPQGPQGEQGIQGIQGVQGSIWYFGTDVVSLGSNVFCVYLTGSYANLRVNDLYLATSTYTSEGVTINEGDYFKVTGLLPSSGYAVVSKEGNLKGEQGDPGIISDATTLNSFLQGSGAAVIGVNQAGTKVDVAVNPGVGLSVADSKINIADIPTVTAQTTITDPDLLSWIEDKKGPVIISGKVYYAFSEDANSIYYISYNWSTGLSGNIVINRPTYSKSSKIFDSPAGSQHVGGLASNSFRGSIMVANAAQPASANNVTSIMGRTYQVQLLNNSEQAVVNVPWPNIAAGSGLEATESADGTTKTLAAKVGSGITIDANGALTATGDSYPTISTGTAVSDEIDAWVHAMKPVYFGLELYHFTNKYQDESKYFYMSWFHDTSTNPIYYFKGLQYDTATKKFSVLTNIQMAYKASSSYYGGIKLGTSATNGATVSNPTTVAGRSYYLQLNTSGNAVVNVPWVEVVANPTLDGTESTLTAIEIGGVKYKIGT